MGLPNGFAEIKCPHKYQNRSLNEAAKKSDFMLQNIMPLACRSVFKESHSYFCQIQGLGQRPWRDFIVYTKKGIHVHGEAGKRNVYLSYILFLRCACIAPEIVCPQHSFGLPLRDLRGE